MTGPLELPSALSESGDQGAVDLVRTYFDSTTTGRYYSGAFFESLDGGGDREGVRNRFTGADLVALEMLSIRPSPRRGAELDLRAAEFEDLLAGIPFDIDLVDVDADLIGPDSSAWRLWELLKTVHDIDWVVANKLLARKRPRLLPVYDNDVRELLGEPDGYWEQLRVLLRADDRALHRRLLAIGAAAGLGDRISALRIFDVICWMEAQRGKPGRIVE